MACGFGAGGKREREIERGRERERERERERDEINEILVPEPVTLKLQTKMPPMAAKTTKAYKE